MRNELREKRSAMRTVDEIKEDIENYKINKRPNDGSEIEVYALQKELCHALIGKIALDRLEEICNAERDGNLRIVTLCKNCCAWKKYPEGSRGYCDYHEKDTEGDYYCAIE